MSVLLLCSFTLLQAQRYGFILIPANETNKKNVPAVGRSFLFIN